MKGPTLQEACPWMLEAINLLGTREVKGPQHESRIVRMWEAIKSPLRDDESPWCAAYVGACLESAGIRSTRSAVARSYVKFGDALQGDLRNAYGAIVVLSRPGSIWSGHVGFLTGYDAHEEVLQLLSGNCDNQVKYAEYPLGRVLAVRWPANWPAHLAGSPVRPCPPFVARGYYGRARSDA